MHLPTEWLDRTTFYDDIVQACLNSQEERRGQYSNFLMYWMHGTGPESSPSAVYNYIYPLIEQLGAFVFASETTRFAAEFPPDVNEQEHSKGPPLSKAISDEWKKNGGDMLFDQAINLGHVFGCELIKLRAKTWRGGHDQIESFLVDPGDFGVLREDVPSLDRQEAFVHSYEITPSQLINELMEAGHPQVDEIARQVVAYTRQATSSTASAGLDRIITSVTQPTIQGNLDFSLNVIDKYRARVSQPVVQMRELYIYDNSIADFRVVTIAEPHLVIFDRPINRMWVDREHPFIYITPTPHPRYFYGISEVERLIGLQMMLNERIGQIGHLLNLHAYQPKAFSGYPGMTDEMALALDTPGGYVQTDMPSAKVDNLAPALPDDLYKEADRIIKMMQETVGISDIMQGKGEVGVRSTGHASQLLRVGASRVKKRANRVEDFLDELATKYFHGLRRYSTMKLGEERKNGIVFQCGQVPKETLIKVDGHSNSPLFVEDATQKVFDLFKVGAIDELGVIDLLDVPMKQYVKWYLENVLKPRKEQEAQMAAAAQAAPSQPAQLSRPAPSRPRAVK